MSPGEPCSSVSSAYGSQIYSSCKSSKAIWESKCIIGFAEVVKIGGRNVFEPDLEPMPALMERRGPLVVNVC